MTDCLFCKIATKEIDSQVVAETEHALAFRDINPAAPTHVLVIPKEHIASAQELGAGHAELLGELFALMGKVGAGEDLGGGHRLVTNVGRDGGQTVDHLHFHVLGGRAMTWPPG